MPRHLIAIAACALFAALLPSSSDADTPTTAQKVNNPGQPPRANVRSGSAIQEITPNKKRNCLYNLPLQVIAVNYALKDALPEAKLISQESGEKLPDEQAEQIEKSLAKLQQAPENSGPSRQPQTAIAPS